MEKTAVDWLVNELNERCDIIGNENSITDIFEQAKEMEKQQAHEYAEFAIRCDRKEMKILNFDGFINLKSE